MLAAASLCRLRRGSRLTLVALHTLLRRLVLEFLFRMLMLRLGVGRMLLFVTLRLLGFFLLTCSCLVGRMLLFFAL